MDVQTEAFGDASRRSSESERGSSNGSAPASLGQLCEDPQLSLVEPSERDLTLDSKSLNLTLKSASDEEKCNSEVNGEVMTNGVSGEEEEEEEGLSMSPSCGKPTIFTSSNSSTTVLTNCSNNNKSCVSHLRLQEGLEEATSKNDEEESDDDDDDDEANLEVSDLINEILHQSSSYLDDQNLNGVEFVDSLPEDLDSSSLDHENASSHDLPLYLDNREKRVSSPDSDCNMTTASEGSSTPTSQLSASSSTQSSEHHSTCNFINSHKDVTIISLNSVESRTPPPVSPSKHLLDCDGKSFCATSVPDYIEELGPWNSLDIDLSENVNKESKMSNSLSNSEAIEKEILENSHAVDRNATEVMSVEAESVIECLKEIGKKISKTRETEEEEEGEEETECKLTSGISKDEGEEEIISEAVAENETSYSGPTTMEVPSESLLETAVGALEGLTLNSQTVCNLTSDSVSETPESLCLEATSSPETPALQEKKELPSRNEVVSEEQNGKSNMEDESRGDTEEDKVKPLPEEEERKIHTKESSLKGEQESAVADSKCGPLEEEMESMNQKEDITVNENKEETSRKCEEKEEKSQTSYDCSCKSRTELVEEGGSVMAGVWAELRSSLRQLHRSMIPQSNQGTAHRTRPSINRIKALANMLVTHDAHQLYLRISHLAHELCIELKVRLLATIHDSPTVEEATAFIQGVCDSYQWVMSVCEALHPALERLDSEHLSRFKLNWVTLNMHIFHSTILTEPDVQDYVQICKEKLSGSPTGEDVMGCLASLHRTLAVAEAVWVRADALLQDFAVERAALSARRRQLLADWEQFKAQQRTQQQQEQAMKWGAQNTTGTSTSSGEEGSSQCPCDDCAGGRGVSGDAQLDATNPRVSLASAADVRPPSSCECHFCNASMAAATTEEPVLPPSSGNSLPPLAQPQLSLYPHIHSTPPGSDIVGVGQSREEMGPIPPAPTTKPPITTNPYLGSDLLTEQLMREWELVYGDALTPPGSHPILPPPDAGLPKYEGDPSSLVSGVETLRISSSRPSYTRTMVDPSLPYVPDSRTTARAHTTILPSSQPAVTTASHPVSLAAHPITSGAHSVSSAAHPMPKVPPSSRSAVPASTETRCSSAPESSSLSSSSAGGSSCCSATNTTSVITHTRAHRTRTTAPAQKGKCLNGLDEVRKCQAGHPERSISRESVRESETSGGDEWTSGDESDSSTTVSSTHQDPHCDCCYCHMLHHKQSGGRQKYSDRRDRLLQILSRKKARVSGGAAAQTSTNSTTPATPTSVPSTTAPSHSSKGRNTPLGGQNIDKILDFIEGNHTDQAKHAKKAAKKARQKQKKMAIRREEEEYEEEDFEEREEDGEEEEVEEDGPLAELRRRAPDVTITVVRPGQQTPRTLASPQMALQRPREPSPPPMGLYKPPAKLVPTLAQTPPTVLPAPQPQQSGSRTILHPSRQSSQPPRQSNNRPSPAVTPSVGSTASGSVASGLETVAESSPAGNLSGLSNILKGMDVPNKDKDKGSQMVTIRRVMDPNNAEPTVTITLKGEQPDKDKVLFKLVNGQAVSGNNAGASGQGNKKSGGGGRPQQQQQQPSEPEVPEGLNPDEVKRFKKRQKKERQKLRKQEERMAEQQKGQQQQLELQKQQEILRQQQEQIHQQQLALQRRQEELLRQQQQQQQLQQNPSINSKKVKDKKKGKETKTVNDPKNSKSNNNSKISNSNNNNNTSSNNNNNNNVNNNNNKNGNKSSSNNTKNTKKSSSVSAVVYDGDDMAQSFNLPPGVTINKVAGQPGMVTISNNMGGAFSQPFLPNPNVYPSPTVPGISLPLVQETPGPKTNGRARAAGLSWNSAVESTTGYPDKDNVIVVDTNNGFLGASPTPNNSSLKCEVSNDERIVMAVNGLVDPSSLTKTQRKKYKKMKKALVDEKLKEEMKQKEEDELMDKMYNIANGLWTYDDKQQQNQQEVKQQQFKKNGKQKEVNQTPTQINNNSKVPNNQQGSKNSKQQQKVSESVPQKQKAHQEVARQDSKTSNKASNKENNPQNVNGQTRKGSNSSNQQGKVKQQQESQAKAQTRQKQLPVQKQSQQNQQQKQSQQQQVQKQSQQQVQKQSQQQVQKQSQQHGQKQSQQQGQKQSQQQVQKQSQQQVQKQSQQQVQKQSQQQVQKQSQQQQKSSQQQKQTQQQQKQSQQQQQKISQQNHQKQSQQKQQQQQPQAQQKQQQQNQKQSQQQKQMQQPNKQQTKQQQQQHHQQQQQQKLNQQQQYLQGRQLQVSHEQQNSALGHLVNVGGIGGFTSRVGYAPQDIAHEVRYAQYRAANANTLAKINYSTYNGTVTDHNQSHVTEEDKKLASRKKKTKKSKKGQLEDMTTIDSVFTPKDVAEGELDETERDVEAFKRFCFNNVPRHAGEKPKVNFNVKDIMIKKRPCNVNM